MTSQFRRDLKKFNRHFTVIKELDYVIKKLVNEKNLEAKYCDHPLKGQLNGARDCHIKPDVILIYQVDKKSKSLILLRLGSHAQLFK